mmetsp:Transcript_29058/g.81789  ORF Transcript_29058/g.81789 Transcript_29058/m.81789 type:complete len:215 (-) Transcript_29058:160-804(-)
MLPPYWTSTPTERTNRFRTMRPSGYRRTGSMPRGRNWEARRQKVVKKMTRKCHPLPTECKARMRTSHPCPTQQLIQTTTTTGTTAATMTTTTTPPPTRSKRSEQQPRPLKPELQKLSERHHRQHPFHRQRTVPHQDLPPHPMDTSSNSNSNSQDTIKSNSVKRQLVQRNSIRNNKMASQKRGDQNCGSTPTSFYATKIMTEAASSNQHSIRHGV